LTVSTIAHWLKGSGGSVGFHGFTDLAADLEASAHSESADDIVTDFDVIKSYTRRVVAGWEDTKNMRRSA